MESVKELQVHAFPLTQDDCTATDYIQTALERIVLDPKYHTPLTLVKAVRNGAVYGAKVRFPHALVMTLLFRSGT